MRLTTINQEVILARSEIVTYFRKWFGPGGYLKKLQMKLNADALTEFYGDKTFGIVRGAGNENYILADGRYFEMKTRWTATVVKDTDGRWRILALHIGTNFLDNPILTKAEAALIYFTAGGVGAGLVVGWLITFLVQRRKKASLQTHKT
jgi:ketosteroid isomerase-like protein